MRIFQVLENTANGEIAGNQTWYRNLHEPLLDLGHDVVLVSAKEGRLARQRNDAAQRARFSQELLQAFRREHEQKPFDLFFAYLMEGMIDTGVIDEIRKTGVPTCNFSCNNAHQFELVAGLCPHFDFMLHSERDVRPKFVAMGGNPIWWPMASNPNYFRPYELPRTVPVSFVGACYGLRPRYVSHLLENGVPLHVYGPGWSDHNGAMLKHYKLWLKVLLARGDRAQAQASGILAEYDFQHSLRKNFRDHVHPPVTDEELIQLYSRSDISLGFLEVHDGHDPSRPVTSHLHLREFEAPMSGALYCTTFSDELAEFFEPDKEVLTYRTAQELLEKVNYYLAHPQEADRVRAAGRKRALSDHTYHVRFSQLFKAMGIKSESTAGRRAAN
jgi:spore maturation protein CgeB